MTNATTDDLPAFPFGVPAGEPCTPVSSAHLSWLERPVTRAALPTGRWVWLVTSHADVRRVLRDPAFSADAERPNFPLFQPLPDREASDRRGLFVRMDGEEHARLRQMLTPEFTIKRVRLLEPLIQDAVDESIRAMRDAGPPTDLVEAFALPVPSKVICHLLGVPYEDHAFFQAESRVMLDLQAPPLRAQAARREVRAYLRSLIERERAPGDRSDDLFGRLLAEHVARGDLEPDELVGVGLLLLIAGHETTANMIGLSVLLHQRYPENWAALATDQTLVEGTVEELLRYLTILRCGLPRLAIEDVEINGQRIRAGDGVIVMLATANRDPTVFDDPHEFEPRRAVNPHLAFGFGAHQCLGQQLARAELRVALTELARAFPRLRVTRPPEEIPIRDHAFVFGLAKLPVTW